MTNNINTKSKEYYIQKTVAEDYDAERFTSLGGKMFDMFEKNVVISSLPQNKNAKILDAGAGSGRFTIEMLKKGYVNVHSCDFSPAMLDIIKSKVSTFGFQDQVKISREDVTNLSFSDNYFDYISCIRVTVNLDTLENVTKAIREFYRVCKPGGVVVFDIVNPMSIAYFGSKKNSMITMKKAKAIIKSIPGIRVKKVFGSRFLSQTAFEKTPASLMGVTNNIDKLFSYLFPFFCVRIYFVLTKD
ncbi:class I SAM-dependent methyltransferase [Methanosarcina vacuolata]|uniref:SAM-dependent methyltransferase n=1 Tax=Methanosarcina vacuolata Z-761 TaxID=1434123 RepID=A0A0E3Q1L6_9EURY|nr:class I SAM-dependent methyltransferase [Methanosarcina vacuolata]AKB43083.1 SAM-dependent methyltransferase [Methanosarcina vacuolata Z-761]